MTLKSAKDWLASPMVGDALKAELHALSTEELDDAMKQELKFGTSGLRGLMGAGNNRMNLHTVARATQGLSEYLLLGGRAPKVCIAYDTRRQSREFAECAARILQDNEIDVYLFDSPRPTPLLSYAIRQLKAGAGIVITASHNPREYNGYKVYSHYGGQITDEEAKAIMTKIEAWDLFDFPQSLDTSQIQLGKDAQFISDELLEDYYRQVLSLSMNPELLRQEAQNLHILYTPLYGTGLEIVSAVLKRAGFFLEIVSQQKGPGGDFATTPYPNPEIEAVYDLARKTAGPEVELILATDPDCDRFGVMARNRAGEFQLLTGNQQAVLICHYLLSQQQKAAGKLQGYVYSSNVSTGLIRRLAEGYGVGFEETLTGFKYIAEKMEARANRAQEQLIFAMEESNGCLAGNFLRDKDGTVGCLLIAETALYYRSRGMTLWQGLEEIYRQWGYYLAETLSLPMPGKEGGKRQQEIISDLRRNWPEQLKTLKVAECRDYSLGLQGLPKANLLKFVCADGSWLAFRPSGTEPKLKVYLEACGNNRQEAENWLLVMKTVIAEIVRE